MYSYLWIEGEKNLDEICLRRFGELPRFADHIGRVSGNGAAAKVHRIEKEDSEGNYHLMFFLWMDHEGGKYSNSEIEEIKRWSYANIRADRTSILCK